MPHSDSLRRLVTRALVPLLALITPFSHIPSAHAAQPIVIGEVAWAGSSASLADEWVEVWNLGDTDLPLAGYSLHGASDKPIFFGDDAVIPAHGTYLVSNYGDSDVKSALGVLVQVVTSSISLSNSALQITLNDGTSDIDVAGDGKTPPAGSSGATKATMLRDGDAWISATTSQNFDLGRTDLGTPGICDGCSSVVQEIEEPPVEQPAVPEPVSDPVVEIPTSTSDQPFVEEQPVQEPVIDDAVAPVVNTSSTETVVEVPPVVEPTQEDVPVVDEQPPMPESNEDATTPVIEEVMSIDTTTSSESVTEPVPEATASDITSVSSVTEPAASATEPVSASVTPLPPMYQHLRLNEIMPQPDGEQEWIEVTSIDPGTPVPLEGVMLYDATGKIATFATGTIDLTTPFVRVQLSSSRLNNDGDTVTLRDPSQNTLDGFLYTFSEKGHPWIRVPDAEGAWQKTLQATPNAANVLLQSEPEQNELQKETPVVTATVSTPTEPIATANTSSPVIQSPTPVLPPAPILTHEVVTAPVKQAAPKITAKTAKTPKTAAAALKTATTKPKTTTKTSVFITHDMAHLESNAGIAVVLEGVVGSPPGLLSGHYFILLSPDGRGLKVHVPTSKKLPPMDAAIRVAGVLNFNDQGIPTLGMRKTDILETVAEHASRLPDPRIVDLTAPGLEDAWSLVQVTGTVIGVKGSIVTLDVGETEIDVTIKSQLGYRTARIAVGDTLRVRGLLDSSTDIPKLVPRTVEDIEILGHAPVLAAGKTSATSLPGWTPFAAAAGAVLGTEGFKQLRERRKQRTLEQMLKTGLASSPTAV
jgi:hypothetical protein